jgi:hypothetical protein
MVKRIAIFDLKILFSLSVKFKKKFIKFMDPGSEPDSDPETDPL